MARARALVLRAPGTNCDRETLHAFEQAGAIAELVHLHRVLETPAFLDGFQILCIPGGFSYGDDVAAGRIFGNLLHQFLEPTLLAFRDRGGLILGICNGFQVLLKTNLLLELFSTGKPRATLALNRHARFEARWIHARFTPGHCAFIKQEEILPLPIAHAEGNFIVAEPKVLAELQTTGRIVATYTDEAGNPGAFPVNPNGSMGDVAGICDSTGQVFALMPHPERYVYSWHHPRWTRLPVLPAQGAGLRLFQNAVHHFA